MAGKLMIAAGIFTVLVLAYFGWKLTARSAYESAEYTILDSDGPFETREYSDLFMATTDMKFDSQGNDGSFMRLFRYISGANDQETKIAMTVPVFMESEGNSRPGQMGFVLPKDVAAQRVPQPSNDSVDIQKRLGGRFAVYRFNGRMEGDAAATGEAKLRNWMSEKGLGGVGDAEVAGYDPPWTPGPLRRNEILIRLE